MNISRNLSPLFILILAAFLFTAVGISIFYFFPRQKTYKDNFVDGERMMRLIEKQLSYGPRHLSAEGHKKTQEFLMSEMERLADETKMQKWIHPSADGSEQELANVIGRFYPEKTERIILATHYDSKRYADRDLKNPQLPMPGANDSASGVAVLLEIARFLASAETKPETGIDIVFFDGEEGEENEVVNFYDWKPIGSVYFAEHLKEIYGNENPASGLVLDMICDKDLKIIKEAASVKNAGKQVEVFWKAARNINGNVFQNTMGPEIRDDHTPLNQAGIPSFLVIDFEYPYFHTTEDTLDKCSAKSLETVYKAVLEYVYAAK